jgi:hypothetical protein
MAYNGLMGHRQRKSVAFVSILFSFCRLLESDSDLSLEFFFLTGLEWMS